MIFISIEFTWFDALHKNRVVVWEEKAMRLPSTTFLPVYMFLLSSGTRQNKKKNPPFRFRLDWFTSYLRQELRWASSVLALSHTQPHLLPFSLQSSPSPVLPGSRKGNIQGILFICEMGWFIPALLSPESFSKGRMWWWIRSHFKMAIQRENS